MCVCLCLEGKEILIFFLNFFGFFFSLFLTDFGLKFISSVFSALLRLGNFTRRVRVSRKAYLFLTDLFF